MSSAPAARETDLAAVGAHNRALVAAWASLFLCLRFAGTSSEMTTVRANGVSRAEWSMAVHTDSIVARHSDLLGKTNGLGLYHCLAGLSSVKCRNRL
jgi:hypothetical protein